MQRKILMVSLALILSLTLILPMTPVAIGGIPRPRHIVIVTIGEPETADPAWLYDTASAELCQHVYDTLIAFNVTRLPDGNLEDPTTAGRTEEFIPALAESWTIEGITETSPEGLTWVQRWTFTIRSGVTFHDGTPVTPQDIEYSFERWMVQCRSGGPTWMIIEPTMGVYRIRPGYPDADPKINGKMIDHAVESNDTHVWFNLIMPYAAFPTIIAQSWAGIVSYNWQTSYGDWPGTNVTFANRWGTYEEWVNWNNPDASPIDKAYTEQGIKPMGCGPYKFDYWMKGVEWQIVKFDDYYGGWPAPGLPAGADFIDTVTEKFISEWATRKMMFLAGDADFCAVPRMNIPELVLNWPETPEQYPPGLRCYPGLPMLVCSPCMFFTYDIATTSPFMGVEGGLPSGTYGETGISPDFFNDIRVRKAFAYAFNYTRYLEEVYMGEASLCPTPIIEGLAFHNPAQTAPWFPEGNLTKARELLMEIPELWENGFTIGLSYNTGNVARQKACEMIRDAMEGTVIGNPKFHVDVYAVDWPTFLTHLVNSELTCFVIGWLADFPDPHNFAMPFMHTEGDFACFQYVQYGQSGRKQISYTVEGVPYGDPNLVIDNAYVDEMIENGVKTTIESERQVIYYELQEIYVAEVPGVPLCKPDGRHFERDWMAGWYYNPIYPGIGYFYHMWKETPATWLPVDVSAVDSITEMAVESIVQVYEGEMRLGGNPVYQIYNLTITRIDNYATPHMILTIMSLNRTYAEGNLTAVPEGTTSDYYWLAAGESVWEVLNWSAPPDSMEAGTWTIGGMAAVVSGEAYDENPANNIVIAPTTIDARELPGDVDGNGIVDIFDAIEFAGHFGGGPDLEELYDAKSDIDGSGTIDIFDAIILAGNFGKTVYDVS